MNLSDTISVDPGRTTLGALHPELTAKFIRSSRTVGVAVKPNRKGSLNFIFAALNPGNTRYGAYMLLLRLAFAALLIVSGSFILYGEIDAPATELGAMAYGIAEIAIGGMLALGFFTRFAMIAAVAGFGCMAVQSILMGVFNMEALMSCFGSLAFLMLGSGKYSIDYLLRKAVIKSSLRRRQRRAADRMSYKAYKVSR